MGAAFDEMDKEAIDIINKMKGSPIEKSTLATQLQILKVLGKILKSLEYTNADL